jgi:DNA-binding NarL/FixJ family response regulator
VRELTAQHPDTRFVLLGDDPSIEECAQLIAFGASASLARNTQSRDVLNAVHLASRGLQVMPRAGSNPGGGAMAAGHRLTGREAEVLPLLQQGRSNAEIALALHVSVETVRTHARNIYRKFGVSSRRELAATRAPEPKKEQSPAARPPLRWGTMPVSARRGHGLRNR